MSVVVVTARDGQRLERCLAAVVREAGDVALEIVVVLNAAEPGLRAAAERAAPRAVVVESDVPLGFAAGLNLGARHARGDLLHILHDDTEVCPGWLDPLLAALDEHPRAGAAGSLILGSDGLVQSAGHVLWDDGNTHPPWHGAPPHPSGLEDVAVHDFCTSAALLVRRAAWDAIGGVDEDIHPAQYVDADLAMALHSRGYVLVCAPRSHVRHARGGTGSFPRKAFAARRNRERFAAKWAADLVHQAPCADHPDAVRRAREATQRRTLAILAMAPSGATSRAPAGHPESEVERLRRERRALLRDVEFGAAYAEHLESAISAAEAEIAHLCAQRDAATECEAEAHERESAAAAELAELRGAAAETEAAAAARAAALEQHVAELERRAAHVAELERRVQHVAELERRVQHVAELERRVQHVAELERHARTLDAITAGGWWRLRARLLPLLRMAGWARRRVRR